VQEVAGIPDDRGDAKQRYVQVTLDRMIFLYFIQEKRLLDRDPNYLHDHHKQRVDAGENVYEAFYEPLFFDFLAEKGKKSTEFGALPYLNGGLFSKNLIEKEFEDARLGDTTERTNGLFGDILDFLSDGTGTWMSGSTLSIRRTSRQPSSVTSSSRRSTKGDGGVLHPRGDHRVHVSTDDSPLPP